MSSGRTESDVDADILRVRTAMAKIESTGQSWTIHDRSVDRPNYRALQESLDSLLAEKARCAAGGGIRSRSVIPYAR